MKKEWTIYQSSQMSQSPGAETPIVSIYAACKAVNWETWWLASGPEFNSISKQQSAWKYSLDNWSPKTADYLHMV